MTTPDRERFFAEMRAAYAAMTDEERAEEAAEMAVWDTALLDGLEDEPWEEEQ